MRYLLLLPALLLALLVRAQVPQAFDFQGVARDASGNVLSGQPIGLRLSVHSAAANGPVVYQEAHAVTTGSFGVFNVQVGTGTPLQGSFASVAWSAAAHFLQVEMDASGGTNYMDMGTTQLLSVPYALHAGSVACPTVSLLGDTLRQGNGCFVIIPGISVANGGCLDSDGDGYYHIAGCGPVDCDDSDALVHPGGTEVCGNGLDDDCDGNIDDLTDSQLFVDWHPDSDGDGFGDAAITISACAQPQGHVLDGGDCDDSDANIFPGQGCSQFCTATEIAWVNLNQVFYLQMAEGAFASCLGSPDPAACITAVLLANQDIPLSAECHTCAAERNACILQNCLAQCISAGANCQACIDNSCNPAFIQCMGLTDSDGDGWADGSDCAPDDPTIHPNAAETCGDGIDSNCDGNQLEGQFMVWPDNDGDGFGSNAGGFMSCFVPPGFAAIDGDCDDSNGNISPVAIEERDGIDNNCDGLLDPLEMDSDQDGYIAGFFDGTPWLGAPILGYSDCDDSNASIFPGATEVCDGIDNNCDGQVDEDCP